MSQRQGGEEDTTVKDRKLIPVTPYLAKPQASPRHPARARAGIASPLKQQETAR